MPRISKRIKNFEITAENNIIQISNIKSYLVDANPNYEYTFSYEFPDKGMGGKTRTRAYNLDHFKVKAINLFTKVIKEIKTKEEANNRYFGELRKKVSEIEKKHDFLKFFSRRFPEYPSLSSLKIKVEAVSDLERECTLIQKRLSELSKEVIDENTRTAYIDRTILWLKERVKTIILELSELQKQLSEKK